MPPYCVPTLALLTIPPVWLHTMPACAAGSYTMDGGSQVHSCLLNPVRAHDDPVPVEWLGYAPLWPQCGNVSV
jgi:hypothetical protein